MVSKIKMIETIYFRIKSLNCFFTVTSKNGSNGSIEKFGGKGGKNGSKGCKNGGGKAGGGTSTGSSVGESSVRARPEWEQEQERGITITSAATTTL